MEFLYNAGEQELVKEAGRIIDASLRIDRLRETDSALDGWRAIGGAGWLHAMLDEELGGAGLSLVVMAGIARESGKVLAVEEFTNNAFLLPRLLSFASDDERGEWLAAHLERPGFIVADGRLLTMTCENIGSDPDVAAAPWCYGVWDHFDAYVVLPPLDGRCRLLRISDGLVDIRTVAQLALGVGSVEVSGGVRSSLFLNISRNDIANIVHEASVIHSAGLVGLAARALDETISYVKVREQFGQPVGRFQVVKHRLANVYVALEVAWNSVLYAALSPSADDIASARLKSIDCALEATKAMVQLLGGVGFTWEHDAHWFLKSALAGAARFGGQSEASFRLGQAVVAASTTSRS